jgi:hypothetical protein
VQVKFHTGVLFTHVIGGPTTRRAKPLQNGGIPSDGRVLHPSRLPLSLNALRLFLSTRPSELGLPPSEGALLRAGIGAEVTSREGPSATVSDWHRVACYQAVNIQALVGSIVSLEAGPLALAWQINLPLSRYGRRDCFATAVSLMLDRDSGELS